MRTYEQGLLDGAKLMFKMFTESIKQLEKDMFDGVDKWEDVERKLREKK